MSSRIDRILRAIAARGAARFDEARAEETFEASRTNLPARIVPVFAPRGARSDVPCVDAEFAAQLIGQDGERRGIRAGISLFDRARMAYTRIEWSGSFDRRARAGRIRRTEI